MATAKSNIRPKLGDWREFSVIAYRRRIHTAQFEPDRKEWVERLYPVPRRGMYIGYRTVADGTLFYVEDEGNRFTPTRYREVWLFVVDARQKPLYVFPEHVMEARP